MEDIDLRGISILIVEPSPLLRTVFRQALRELGATDTEVVSTPEEGFDVFNTQNPDIVLTDWSPACDGLALLQRLREDPASANCFVPVIITSAHTGAMHVTSARDRGMHEFLAKPVSAKTLYRRIARIAFDNRAFVRADRFFGPDRRRRAMEPGHPDRRLSMHTPQPVA